MGDLAEFLLARIAEDEERATFVQAQQAGQNWAPLESWRLSWQDEYDLLCIEPSRALAGCQGKRWIVENAEAHHPGERGYGAAQYAVQCLALEYADHPDYREEWRP